MNRHGFYSDQPFEPVFDYSYAGVMRSFDDSLARLSHSRVELLLAHDLGPSTHPQDDLHHWRDFVTGGYRAMLELRDAGRTSAIGLGVNEVAICERALDELDIDCLLLAGRYTLLEQSAFALLERCRLRGVAVVIGGPFNSGILAQGFGQAGPSNFNYAPAPAAILARAGLLAEVCRRHQTPLAAAALQFPLAHPAVVTVLPGLGSAREVTEALQLAAMPIPTGLWEEMTRLHLIVADAPVPAPKAA